MSQRSSDHTQLIVRPFSELSAPDAGGLHRIDLREIFRILRRRINLIVLTTVVLIALAVLFVTVVTPLYSATSTIFIDPRRSSVLDSNSNASAGSFGTDDASVESQVSLIQSLAVIAARRR